MRIAVIADVHANLPALEAVLAAAGRAGVDEIWCLGDTVGVGAWPAECFDLVEERCALVLAGNHEVMALVPLSCQAFWKEQALRTRALLDGPRLARIAELSPLGVRDGVVCMHASLADPFWEPIASPSSARGTFSLLPTAVGLFAHTHLAGGWRLEADHAVHPVGPGGIALDEERPVLLNPGSVGNGPSGAGASWLLLDLAAGRAEWHAERFDEDASRDALVSQGVDPQSVERLLGRRG